MRAYRHARECPGLRWILVASNHSQDRSVDKNLLQRTLLSWGMPGTRESVPSMRCSLIEAIWCICYRSIFLCFSLGTKVKFPRLFSDVSWIEGSQKLLSFHCSLKIKTIPSSLCTFCIFYRRKFCVYFWQKCFYFISLYSLIERKWFINCSIFENLLTANSEKRWVRSVFAAPTTTTTKNSSNTHYDQAPPFTACHYLSPDGYQTDQCGDLEKHSSMVVRARNFRYHQSRFDGVWLVSFLLWDWAQPGWNFHRQYR